jgi:predicted metallopeptidase
MRTKPLLLSWNADNPLPRLVLRPSQRMQRQPIPVPPRGTDTGPHDQPFDFSRAMSECCGDIAAKCSALSHIDPNHILFTIIKARNGQRHGLQARVTPLRCEGGTLTTHSRRTTYQVQRYQVEGREILYLITFCLPRFQNRTFASKLVTIFHELYHISESFNGALRRFDGRYTTHTASQKEYDTHMAALAEQYLRNGADLTKSAFLQLSFWQLCRRHGTVVGDQVPRPKLIPVE